jgi:iron complex outermembrane receptor protein
MTAKKLYCLLVLLVCQSIFAQRDTISVLHEVVVSDIQLQRFSNTQHIEALNDSVIRNNRPSLTSLLQFNSVIYFKENGLGSVSSPSFRGTTAQQTAVIWNGININSSFNGQTDFNTISTSDFNTVSVRSGGGSVIYGSSAIGGSIHLNNDISFLKHYDNSLNTAYGSFNTLSTSYRFDMGSDKFALQASVSHNNSDNDYKFPDGSRKNINGQYDNTSLTIAAGYKINASNYLKFYSQVFDGDRHFPLLTPSDTKTKYIDLNSRNVLEWTNLQNQFTSKFRLAYLDESYAYFENVVSDTYSYGVAETVIAKYDIAYRFGKTMLLNAVVDYTQTNGRGSDVDKNKREIGSGSLLFRQQLSQKLLYEVGIRKEITSSYESPVLFSAGATYAVAKFYSVKINGSRNFRIPTFNDLYWADGGNPNLKPESSWQGEIDNEFKLGSARITLNGYYIKITDMIQWLPGTTSTWFPQNINKVNSYGGEALIEWHKNFGNHHFLVNGTYAYTVSENADTNKQLIYVPFHKATASLVYGYRKFSLSYQGLFNGEVFTRTDNNPIYNLDAYAISNFGMSYDFGKKIHIEPSLRLLNAFNTDYQTMDRRPYPGRNYNVSLTLIF